AEYYKKRFKDVYEKINSLYWDEEKNAFVDDYRTGNRNVTRHANIFALLYNLTTEERKAKITEHVIKNDDVQAITTPYFKFFELASMSEIGDYKYVANSLRDYWGGMIKLGATSFWEEYDPAKRGAEHYAMYGRPYDKSLCHAWGGTSPIYLLGRYILGVFPTSPGYATYEVKPCVTDIGFGKTEGTVPTPRGNIKVKIDEKSVTVISDMDGGTLVLGGKTYIIPENKALTVEIHD
ncbi:MAG: trehalase family glycosidase, partial [Eubacteriales bacterium]